MAGSTVINKDNVWSTFPARSLRERLRNRRVKGKIPGKVKKKKKKSPKMSYLSLLQGGQGVLNVDRDDTARLLPNAVL